MKNNEMNALYNDTKTKIQKLQVALELYKINAAEEGGDIIFDGVIKRFERLFQSTAQLLRSALAMEGIETESPYQSIQEATTVGWIKEREFWLNALDARMETVRGFEETEPNELTNIFSQFIAEAEAITSLIENLHIIKK